MTHEEFDLNLERVKSGKGAFLIPTAYRCIFIEKKSIDKFAAAGKDCIKKGKDGRGFWIVRGRHYDYVFANYLIYRDYASDEN